jgi:POT family proton-dependent oligopeptide transporter
MENTVKRKHPRGLYVLFFTEMWERFGYYLMVGIFLLYMIDPTKNGGRGFTLGDAADIVGTYVALVYLTPFIGGLLADKVLGYRVSIALGGSLMAAGYFGLAIPSDSAMYISCLLIIIGNGFFKPNISTLLGNMYNKEELLPMKDSAYNIFYMGINIGAFFCNFVAAYLRNQYGWGYAFAAAGVGMVIGLIWFLIGSKHVKEADVRKPTHEGDMTAAKVILYVFLPALIFGWIGWIIPGSFSGRDATDAFFFACIPITIFYISLWVRARQEDKRGIGALLAIYFVSIIFWIIYNQNATGLTIWAESYTDRQIPETMAPMAEKFSLLQKANTNPTDSLPVLDRYFRAVQEPDGKPKIGTGVDPYFQNIPKENWPAPGKDVSLVNAEIFQSTNPFFIVLFTPLVLAIFAWFTRRGKTISTPAKIVLAMVFTGLSALVMVFAVKSTDIYANKAAAYWLISSYAVFTIGELCISPVGLSLVSKLAPQRITALMMGGWFLTTSIGGKLSGILASMWNNFTDKSTYFWILTILCVAAAVMMLFMLKWIRGIVKEKTGHI